ncbi:Short-chain dehydrogenase/reductase SDR [Pseudomonas sp. CFII68]|nr:Short-chain dehydrogenase/reductase SDR [Pseudomonas sp. CFII68]
MPAVKRGNPERIAASVAHGAGIAAQGCFRCGPFSKVVAFLASDRASFIVGSVVMADGGMTVTAG